MFNITNNNIITVNRGDSVEFDILPNIGTVLEPDCYVLQENDKIYFGVMEPTDKFEDGLIRKVYTSLDQKAATKAITIKLQSTDTEYLLPGTYYWSVKLEIFTINGNKVSTLIPRRKFIIIE